MKNKPKEYWKDKLTEEQFNVCRLGKTETAFTGKYTDHFQRGMYHCAACGVPSFSSEKKYKSNSGWPAFWDYANEENIKTVEDNSLGMHRIEVKCSNCDSHLGHLFEGYGPKPTQNWYCINSAALDFKPSNG